MRPATEVHLPNRALALIDPQAPTVKASNLLLHLVDTLVWLGVSRSPNDTILTAAVTRLEMQEDSPDRGTVIAILDSPA